MGYKVAYLVKIYNNPPTLVMLIARERTWENKGTKHIKVLGMEDKRQITLVISSTVDGLFLFF
jgi:hypothetical protein